MEQSTNENPNRQAPAYLQWVFPSYIKHERTFTWFIVAIAALLGLLIFALVNRNFLFAIIIILIAAIAIGREFRPPQQVNFLVDQDGIKIGDQYFRFKEFSKFWIAYEPPTIKTLYLEFKGGFKPSYPIPLQDQNPLRIRAILQKHILEDIERENEDLTDRLGRVFKL